MGHIATPSYRPELPEELEIVDIWRRAGHDRSNESRVAPRTAGAMAHASR
jgi:hypothetical protein